MNTPYFETRAGSTGSTLLALAAGALVGAAVALAFTPANGRETRAFLGQRSRRLAGDAAERARRAWAENGGRVTTALHRGYIEAAQTLKRVHPSANAPRVS